MNLNFTQTVTADTFVLPTGAKTIMTKNAGAGAITFIGTSKAGSFLSNEVVIAVDEYFTFPYLADGYGEIEFDATLSVLQIVAVYADKHG